MNVYDFDKTVFYPDSMILFAKFCIRKHPALLFNYLPKLIKAQYGYIRRKHSVARIHATLGSVIKYLNHADEDIAAFGSVMNGIFLRGICCKSNRMI